MDFRYGAYRIFGLDVKSWTLKRANLSDRIHLLSCDYKKISKVHINEKPIIFMIGYRESWRGRRDSNPRPPA